jgi:hypothetical protein
MVNLETVIRSTIFRRLSIQTYLVESSLDMVVCIEIALICDLCAQSITVIETPLRQLFATIAGEWRLAGLGELGKVFEEPASYAVFGFHG